MNAGSEQVVKSIKNDVESRTAQSTVDVSP